VWHPLFLLSGCLHAPFLAAACRHKWGHSRSLSDSLLHLTKLRTLEAVANNHNSQKIAAGLQGPAGWCWASCVIGFINAFFISFLLDVLFLLDNACGICKSFVIESLHCQRLGWQPFRLRSFRRREHLVCNFNFFRKPK